MSERQSSDMPEMIVVDGVRYRREEAPEPQTGTEPGTEADTVRASGGKDGSARHKARRPAQEPERGATGER